MEIQKGQLAEVVKAMQKVYEISKYDWIYNLEILTWLESDTDVMRIYVKPDDFFDTFRDYETDDINQDWGKYKLHYVVLGGVKFYTCTETELKK